MNSTTTTSPTHQTRDISAGNSKVQAFVAQNKVALSVALAVIIAAIVGFGLFKTFADKSKSEYNSKIYSFETSTLKDFLASPLDPKLATAVERGVQNLHLEMGEYLGLLPVIIKSTDALMNSSHFAEARSLLSIGEKISNDDYSDYFIMSRQAVVYEDLGEDKLAIETLEKMTSHSVKIFEGKTYLDLGRLYLKAGNKEKAKASFTHVVEKAKGDAEFVKIAQLYLASL